MSVGRYLESVPTRARNRRVLTARGRALVVLGCALVFALVGWAVLR